MIYIKFGKPDDIERSPITMGTNPWVQWHYFELEGGVVFVFADRKGISNWRLVHSTYPGELYDPDWNEKLFRMHDIGRPGGAE